MIIKVKFKENEVMKMAEIEEVCVHSNAYCRIFSTSRKNIV